MASPINKLQLLAKDGLSERAIPVYELIRYIVDIIDERVSEIQLPATRLKTYDFDEIDEKFDEIDEKLELKANLVDLRHYLQSSIFEGIIKDINYRLKDLVVLGDKDAKLERDLKALRISYEAAIKKIVARFNSLSGMVSKNELDNAIADARRDILREVDKKINSVSGGSGYAFSNGGGSGGGAVDSVNGQTGVVVIDTDDIAEGTNLYFTDERAQDAVGTILNDSSTIDFTYNDAGGTISAAVIPGGVDHDALLNFVANEHIDWTSTSSNLNTSGSVTGGQVNADNLRLDGNTLSATNTNGEINITPNGTGGVKITKPNSGGAQVFSVQNSNLTIFSFGQFAVTNAFSMFGQLDSATPTALIDAKVPAALAFNADLSLSTLSDINVASFIFSAGNGANLSANQFAGFSKLSIDGGVAMQNAGNVLFFISPITGGMVIGRSVTSDAAKLYLYTDPLGVGYLKADGGATFNEEQLTGAEYQFVYKGSTDTALIHTDSTNDRVGFGTATPGSKVDVAGSFQCDSITNDTGLAHGTYTPTLTGVTNIAASTAYPCQWMRVGNTITVSGKVDIDVTTGAVAMELGISLPVASNFANDYECGGCGYASTVARDGFAISGDPTNNRARAVGFVVSAVNQSFFFTFTYQVI